MPDPGENIQSWSTTALANGAADSLIAWPEGQTRASVNNSARGMMAAHAKDRNLHNGSIVTTGTANAQAFISGVGYTVVPTGLVVRLKIGVGLTNTGIATLNMDGIGAVAIKNQKGEDIRVGDLIENSFAEFIYSGTNWILLYSIPAVTQAPGTVVIEQPPDPVNSPTVDFTEGLDDTYDDYMMLITAVKPSVDDTYLCMQIGKGTPPVWQSNATVTAPAYGWGGTLNGNAGSFDYGYDNSPTGGGNSIAISPASGTVPFGLGIGSHAGAHFSGHMYFSKPASTTDYPIFDWRGRFIRSVTAGASPSLQLNVYAGGNFRTVGAFTGLRFFMSSGNIVSGKFQLYGLNK